MHTCTHAHMHTCTHAHMHTCTHAHMHTYTHTYTHTLMHTYALTLMEVSLYRWQILYQCASVVGIVHPVGYPFLLFDVCMMSPTLQSVLKSILLPARQLGMTAVLICFIVYMFSFVSVTGFRRSFLNSLSFALLDPSIPPEEQEMTMAEFDCQSLIDCFVKQLHYGLIVGTVTTTLQAGGYDYNVMPGDDWFNRVILDLTFWLVITIFM